MSNDDTSAKAREILEASGIDVEENKGRGPSQASQLVALARERYDLFMSEDGRPYGVKADGANIALPLRGKAGLRSQRRASSPTSTAGRCPHSRRSPTR